MGLGEVGLRALAGGRTTGRPWHALALLAALACGVAGCGRGDDASLFASADSSGVRPGPELANPAAIPHPSPPQPRGSQVGRRDPVLNAAAQDLEAWAAMWRAALPGFQVDSTWSTGVERWVPARRTLGRDVDHLEMTGDLAYALLAFKSPDGRYVLDVDWYQIIAPAGDSLEVGGDADSQPVLVDRGARTESVLQFCGTACGFHWGRWLSPTRFAIGGWQVADDYSQWLQGSLLIYSIRDSTVRRYETRIVSAADYARYEAAWKRWLLRRYRALPARGPA